MQDLAIQAMAEGSLGDSWAGLALLLALFSGFFVGALGYGSLLRSALFARAPLLDRVGDSFLLSSVALYSGAFLLASLGLLSVAPGWAFGIVFLPGVPAGWRLLRETLGAAIIRFPLAGTALLALVFLVRWLSAAQPSQHGDPLLYHLLGPRLWAAHGGFYVDANLPNALLASTWECLYVWPQLFWISPKSMYGLVEAQLFSQWLHLFLAWGGCFLLVPRLFRGSVREAWLPLTGFAALFVAGVQWTAPLAKNDVGIAFWCLGAIVLFVETLHVGSVRKGGLAGLLAGLAVAGKITALLSLAPILGLLTLVHLRALPRLAGAAAAWLLGFALGALPLYVRNGVLTANPFFPLFPRIFPSPWVSKSWEAHFAQVHPASSLHSLGRLAGRLPELWRETPWSFAALLFLLLVPFARNRLRLNAPPERLAILGGAVFAYAIFVVTQAPEIELRYLGAALMVLAGGGIAFLLQLAERMPSEAARRGSATLLLILTLATSRLPLHLLRKIWAGPLGAAYVRTHSAGEAKAWLRAHGAGGMNILAGDNETYYLTPVPVAVLTERPDLDEANAQTTLPSFLAVLCRLSHAHYLLDARPEIGVQARFGAAPLAPAKVFSAQGANVYDLRRLGAGCR